PRWSRRRGPGCLPSRTTPLPAPPRTRGRPAPPGAPTRWGPAPCAPTGRWATRSRRTARRTGATLGRCSTSARSASSRGTPGQARAGVLVEQGDAGGQRAAAGPADAPVVQLGRDAVQGDDVRV